MIQRYDSPLTSFDHYLISSLNIKQKGNERCAYKCFINPISNCEFVIYSRTQSEVQRFFFHLVQSHPDELFDVLVQYVNEHSFTNMGNISCADNINEYIKKIYY